MFYFAYMLKSVTPGVNKTYVGYTNNLKARLKKHNSNTGAKSTKGYNWVIIYNKRFKNKNAAMSYEYKLKNDRVLRKKLLEKSI